MSYPYDLPAESMNQVWNSGAYTPEDIVSYIRDTYTPVNKTSMRNSLGYEVSLLQNFVNSHYLGRADTPVLSGFITNNNVNAQVYSTPQQITFTGGYITPSGSFIELTLDVDSNVQAQLNPGDLPNGTVLHVLHSNTGPYTFRWIELDDSYLQSFFLGHGEGCTLIKNSAGFWEHLSFNNYTLVDKVAGGLEAMAEEGHFNVLRRMSIAGGAGSIFYQSENLDATYDSGATLAPTRARIELTMTTDSDKRVVLTAGDATAFPHGSLLFVSRLHTDDASMDAKIVEIANGLVGAGAEINTRIPAGGLAIFIKTTDGYWSPTVGS